LPHDLRRRDFLGAALAAGGLAALRHGAAFAQDATGGAATDTRPADEVARDEAFWSRVRDGFTLDPKITNFNNGGVSPSPRVVQEAMARYLAIANGASSHALWRVLEPEIEKVRTRLAATFGCSPEEIAITRNTSEALETVQLGLDLAPGDEVVTTELDYPRMITTWRQRERRNGIVLKLISIPVPATTDDEAVARFEKAITPKTRVFLLSHVVGPVGQILPVKKICQLARSRGIEAIVDGAHGFAHFPWKHEDLDCDYYATSLHKWLMAPHGTGFLYVRRSKIPKLWPLMAAPAEHDADIRKFEEIGTHPAANHNAIAEALSFHEALGPERKIARLRFLRERWSSRLAQAKGARLWTGSDPRTTCGIGLVGFEGVDPGKLAGALLEKHGFLTSPISNGLCSGIRVTPSVYTSLAEVDAFCAAVEKEIS
jgi:selenocysteine lyase/cysteine desulfurase